ncbi:HD domain-containing protein [Candidatus Uhrbacteria bacterium]|nr:HD domain-containing protein [Candidatus Uhrbacteria bacterium]
MEKSLGVEFEKAVRLLVQYMPPSDEQNRKPALFHDIRVGVYLYERNYSMEIVLAGILHDAIEWSRITDEMLRKEFGDTITGLVRACTKDDSIKDPVEKIEKIIKQCVATGEDALIVKAADIIDSFKWYTIMQNEGELKYCMRNADAIFRLKPEHFQDKIFNELQKWYLGE